MSQGCVFCGIVRPASIVWEDDLTIAFMDRRQFHAPVTRSSFLDSI